MEEHKRVRAMQSKVAEKQDEIKQMRQAAARGGPNPPGKHEQIAAVKELVALKRQQARAAKALLPERGRDRRQQAPPTQQSSRVASPSRTRVAAMHAILSPPAPSQPDIITSPQLEAKLEMC